MEQALLRQLAQFKLLLRRITNQPVDIERLILDKAYGHEVLTLAENTDDETLVLIALELKDKLGMLPQPTPAIPVKAEVEDAKPTDKYVFGARG